jgi:hypothetical protein
MLSAAQIEQLPDEVKDHIAGLTHQYESRISQAELEIEDLQEQLKLARFRKFARSSESADSGENCHPFRLKTATPGQCDQPLVIGIPGGRFGSRITV